MCDGARQVERAIFHKCVLHFQFRHERGVGDDWRRTRRPRTQEWILSVLWPGGELRAVIYVSSVQSLAPKPS